MYSVILSAISFTKMRNSNVEFKVRNRECSSERKTESGPIISNLEKKNKKKKKSNFWNNIQNQIIQRTISSSSFFRRTLRAIKSKSQQKSDCFSRHFAIVGCFQHFSGGDGDCVRLLSWCFCFDVDWAKRRNYILANQQRPVAKQF